MCLERVYAFLGLFVTSRRAFVRDVCFSLMGGWMALHERELQKRGKNFFSSLLAQDIDLLNPPAALEASKHKLKRLVQGPNSFFMDVKCQGCFSITTVFSHSQTVVLCGSCSAVLCQPTGGKARLTEGCSFRKKTD
ncbi:40S ribosomal protein S27 [Bathycoccus prasinos]|uniref:40S ribosomal protein S27 n=1 Tax=Bathycoccus prasinos TaxID=41875 RepID=K8F2K9_9CHLO|nr:40S ribosomal protein S27 [Bathycoccus prasinos]CCO66300.1 40S ribosomal protein S27 [Bathycoccus prasinos]|eukprot:XP_007512212.1 40S ribosomal protein S27 [Bathycoccus prasinos]